MSADRSTPELFADAIDDTLTLVRHEIDLAKAGIVENVLERLKGLGLAVAAGVMLIPAVIFLAMALAFALPFSEQTGFFIVGLVLLIAAGVGVYVGVRLVKKGGEGSKPALDAVKEDVRWARTLIKR